jgi:hypothetical protein
MNVLAAGTFEDREHASKALGACHLDYGRVSERRASTHIVERKHHRGLTHDGWRKKKGSEWVMPVELSGRRFRRPIPLGARLGQVEKNGWPTTGLIFDQHWLCPACGATNVGSVQEASLPRCANAAAEALSGTA